MTENAASTVPETEAVNTAETSQSASSEPVEENSANSDLPSTSGQSEELMRKLAEFTANTESVTSIGEELENIPQVRSELQSEQCSHTEKETGADKNEEELENLDSDYETSGNVDTSDIVNTVELDYGTSIAQSQGDRLTEAQSISATPESSSLAETQALRESETLDIQQDETVNVIHNVPEEMNTAEESDITENFNMSSARDNAVEEMVQSLSPQVTVNETSATIINENSRTSEMYPNLDSIARESGTAIF